MANDILVKIGADITNFSRAMADSQKALRKFSDENQLVFDSFKQTGAMITGTGIALAGGLGYVSKQAIDFESSFAGVRKTVDATEEEFEALSKGLRDMSKELPASIHEINGVAEAAGQLGIEKENILEFTRTMIDLGEATNMSSDEAATSFARFANIVGMSQGDFDRLGSVVVDLGNNFATTESEIVEMSMRLAGVGNQVGMTEADIMALATSMSSVGIEAEAGGTAMTMAVKKMQNAVSNGGKSLDNFAKVAGMSSKEFADAFNNDPITALDAFVKGLAKSGEEGENLNAILDSVGIKGIRESDTLLRLAGASDILSEAVSLASNAWEENSALSDEARQRYETVASQLKILKNTIIDAAISFGNALLPAISAVTSFIKNLVEWFNGLSETFKHVISITTALVAVFALIAGPILLLIGFIPQIITGFQALATVFTFLTGPIGLTVAAIGLLVAAFVIAYNKVEWFRDMVDEAWAWIKDAFFTALSWIKDSVVVPIMTEIAGFINEILGKIREFWDKYGDAILNLAKNYFQAVWIFIQGVMGWIKGIFEIVWPIIYGVVKIAWEYIKLYVRNGIDIVMGIIDTVMALIQGDWEGAWNSVKATVEKIWSNIKSFFESVDLVQTGKDIIKGLIKGIGSMGSAVWEATKGIGSKIKNGFTSFFKIKSPSRLMMSLAKHIPGGAIAGMDSMRSKVEQASDRMAEAMTPDVRSIDMSYATPSGLASNLSAAVAGTVDVNAREEMIAGAIDNLNRKLDSLRIEMNEREMGRFVSDVATESRDSAVRSGGRRRL